MRIVLLGLVSAALAALGVRLLRLSSRTGKRPERWLGSAFLWAGASAWLLPLAAREGMPHETARGLALAAQSGLTAAIACFVVFTRETFRPDAPAARAGAAALVALNVGAGAAVVASGMPIPVGALGLVVVAARAAALLWLFAESARYALQMRRRVALGLADPVVANRFALWTIWTGAIAGIPLFVGALRAVGALDPVLPGEPLPISLRAVFAVLGAGGAAAGLACWLAFFPPSAYLRWVTAHAPPRSA